MRIAYQVVLEKDEKGVFAFFPDLEEAHTEGETEAEALYNAEEVLNLTLEGRLNEGMEIPEPKEHSGGIWVYPSPQVQAAVLIHLSRRGRSLAELARALGTSWPSAQRLEDPKHSPTLRQLQKAAGALGQRMIIVFEPLSS